MRVGKVVAPSESTPALGPGEGRSRRAGFRRVRFLAVIGGALAAPVAVALLAASSGGSPGTDFRGGSGAQLAGQPVMEVSPAQRGAPVELGGTTLDGATLDLADLRGRVVVVNVWGSWCAPCRTEAPVLAKLSRSYADRGVAFVGVNVKDNRAAALAFERTYGLTYPSIEDRDGRAVLALSRHVPASAVPVTLVLDGQGRVAARVLGAVREATLRALLESVLP